MNINYLHLLLFITLGFIKLSAQQAITSAGKSTISNSGSISYSIGQIGYTTSIGSSGSMAKGVQQPYEISVVLGVEEATNINLSFTAYPNPTLSLLNLDVSNYNLDFLTYQLYDINGKLLLDDKIFQKITILNIENFSSGTYLIKILDKKSSIKTFKIIKN